MGLNNPTGLSSLLLRGDFFLLCKLWAQVHLLASCLLVLANVYCKKLVTFLLRNIVSGTCYGGT